ncbi:MAG: stage II sporulation protein R [Oscillospiraceae bacterium]|nr:stage II sporulation protein R [Oscillospiraceae bacterium]
MKEKKHTLHIWELALIAALFAGLVTGLWAQKAQAAVASELVRLHVQAKDDTPEEQRVKLAVRDEVLEYLQPVLAEAQNKAQAQALLDDCMEDIRAAAMTAAGDRQVAVTLTEEFYPTRVYEDFSLPAGRYTSLRVILAEGNGQNWWCVVYPPLCTELAMEAMDVLSDETESIILQKDGYVYKFKILELFGELQAKFQ